MKIYKNKISAIGLWLFLIVFTFLPIKAQDSLQYYITQALKNNPVVLQNYYEYQASLKKIPQAGSLPDPTLNAGVFLSPMELVAGNQVAEFQLMQMFPWFGTLRAAKDEMSLMANAKFEAFRDTKLQLIYDLQKAYYDLYKLRQQQMITDKNIEILRSIERMALIRFKTGSGENDEGALATVRPDESETSGDVSSMQGMQGSQGVSGSSASSGSSMQGGSMSVSSGSGFGLADLYRIRIEIAEIENSKAYLKNQENVLMATFNSFLNRPVLSPVYIPDTVIADSVQLNVSAVEDSMLVNNPMLRMIDFERKSYLARKRMNTRMGYPMVGVGLNYSVISKSTMSDSEMNGNDMIMPMVNVSLPVYRKKYRAMREESELLSSSSEQKYNATANDLKTGFLQAIQLYDDSGRRIILYAEQSELVQKSLDILVQSFATSGAGLTEILRTRQQLLDYKFRYAEAVSDHNTSIALLKRLSGNSINN